ncbi:MAG: prolipoprotein diacylglyceryl transferase [Chlamydiota bacterium]
MIASIFWDPSPFIFDFPIPLLGRPLLWYGFLFALGFFCAYWVLLWGLTQEHTKKEAKRLAEKLTFYVILGTVIGARLGDLLFYQEWTLLFRNPSLIFKVWEGGLASHGGAAGILVALYLFSRKEKKISWLHLIDLIALATGVVCGFIRIGNFINQEILGKITNVPWAVVFGHPADGSAPAPRHPVQLYESLYYFLLFFFLIYLWRKYPSIRQEGKLCGILLIFVFTFRFFIEFLKEESSVLFAPNAFLDMGQYLSIPFIVLGVFLLLRK